MYSQLRGHTSTSPCIMYIHVYTIYSVHLYSQNMCFYTCTCTLVTVVAKEEDLASTWQYKVCCSLAVLQEPCVCVHVPLPSSTAEEVLLCLQYCTHFQFHSVQRDKKTCFGIVRPPAT